MNIAWDPDAMDDWLQDTLRTLLAGTYTPLTVASADSIEEATKQAVADTFRLFTVTTGSKSPGRMATNGAGHLQVRDPITFCLVGSARNLRTNEAGRRGALRLILDAERAIAGQIPPTCLSPIVFQHDYLVRRDAGTVVWAALLRTKALDFL
jgi:hypothetical protein